MKYKWTYLQNRNRFTDIENGLVVAKREGEGRGMDGEFASGRGKLLYLEWTSNEILPQCRELYPMSWDRTWDSMRKRIYMYMYIYIYTHTHTEYIYSGLLCYAVEINTIL